MITGGQRSGKSVFAENLAIGMSDCPVYLATAQVFDDEMKRRVEIHKQRRKERWINLESNLFISENKFTPTDVVLIDCLTLLASNWFFERNESKSEAFEEIKKQIDNVIASGATFIIVTNEIGLGGVSSNKMQRDFTDLQGKLNQYIAGIADEVYLVVSGIPVKIKSII